MFILVHIVLNKTSLKLGNISHLRKLLVIAWNFSFFGIIRKSFCKISEIHAQEFMS